MLGRASSVLGSGGKLSIPVHRKLTKSVTGEKQLLLQCLSCLGAGEVCYNILVVKLSVPFFQFTLKKNKSALGCKMNL